MAAPSKLTLKLLIDKKSNKVVFAEAGEESVDFLCRILTLPVGAVAKLLSEQGMVVGCLSNLYKSIQNLNGDGMDAVLKPTALHRCPGCQFNLNTGVKFVEGNEVAPEMVVPVGGGGGFVKPAADRVVTYIVMDDLVFSPTSAITGVSFLNKLKVDARLLEEKVVELDMAKGLKLLKASFQTKNVLTEVFLRGDDNRKTGSFVRYPRAFVILMMFVIFVMIGEINERTARKR